MADTDQKDLDFDELHQAVNALMDQAQKGKSGKKQAPHNLKPAAPLGDKPLILDDDEKTTGTDDTLASKQGDSQDDTQVKVAVKRPLPQLVSHRGPRGRAMDIVGPRAAGPITPPSAQIKREAPVLQPTKPIAPEPIVSVEPPVEAEKPATEVKEPSDDVLASLDLQDSPVPKTAPIMTHQKSEWPDPLDVHEFNKDDEPVKSDDVEEPKPEAPAGETEEKLTKDATDEAQPTLESEEEVKQEVGDELAKDEDPLLAEPTSTPFLATKVEKRPLGAYTDTVPNKLPDEKTEASADNEVEVDKIAAPSPLPTQQQPEELSPEVVAVESAEPEMQADAPEDVPDEQPEDEGVNMDSLRTMAIPQQYKEADKAESAGSRPVFDTKEYHPAIEAHAQAAKHGSASGWIMGILLIILLIVALGVAYYLITGGLDFSTLFS